MELEKGRSQTGGIRTGHLFGSGSFFDNFGTRRSYWFPIKANVFLQLKYCTFMLAIIMSVKMNITRQQGKGI